MCGTSPRGPTINICWIFRIRADLSPRRYLIVAHCEGEVGDGGWGWGELSIYGKENTNRANGSHGTISLESRILLAT